MEGGGSEEVVAPVKASASSAKLQPNFASQVSRVHVRVLLKFWRSAGSVPSF